MANVKINSAYMENCNLEIKDSSGNAVAYTWADDRLSITTDMVKGQSYAFKVSANPGYAFTSPVTIRLSYNNYSFTLSDDAKSATYYGANMDPVPINYETITIRAQAQEDPNSVTVTEYLDHCTSNISGQTLTKGEPHDIILTADTGYVFNSTVTIRLSYNTYSFTLSDDRKSATYYGANMDAVPINYETITIRALAEVDPNEVTIDRTESNVLITLHRG